VFQAIPVQTCVLNSLVIKPSGQCLRLIRHNCTAAINISAVCYEQTLQTMLVPNLSKCMYYQYYRANAIALCAASTAYVAVSPLVMGLIV